MTRRMVGRNKRAHGDISGEMSDNGDGKALSLATPEHPMHFTGERYTPGVEGEIEHEHLHRYLFACSFARAEMCWIWHQEKGMAVLLAQVARSVVGVDIDAQACGLLTRTTHATIFHSRPARRPRFH